MPPRKISLVLLSLLIVGGARADVVTFSAGDADLGYTDTTIVRTVYGQSIKFSGVAGQIGYFGFDGTGLYSYDFNTASSVQVTVTAPDGYAFELQEFQAMADVGAVVEAWTLGDGSTGSGTCGVQTSALSSCGNLSGSRIGKLVLTSDGYAVFQNFNFAGVYPLAPKVATGTKSSVTSTGATVSGTVNADGFATTDSIQYGTAASYGTAIAASPATTTGTSTTTIGATLSGLTPNTTYHYRVKAVNAKGTAYGADSTFTTSKGALTIVGAKAQDKVYDGTVAAVVTGAKLSGISGTDDVSLALGTAKFASKDTGTAKSVTVTGSSLSGGKAANYTLTEVAGLSANIAARPLLVRADSITWDLAAAASAPALTYTDTGLVSPDVLSGSLQRASGDAVGRYAISRGTLSASANYDLSFVGASFDIVDTRTTALAIPQGKAPVSHEIAASVARSFGSLAQGVGAARIGTDLDGSSQSVDVLLPGAAAVSVSIWDNLGTRVIAWNRDVADYDLANLDATGDGRWVLPVAWNGRASDGTAVSAGVYLWKIVVRTEDGRKLETVRKLGLK
jgi:hypothetical protein